MLQYFSKSDYYDYKTKKISSKFSSGIIHSVPYKNATLSGYSLSTKLHILVGHPVKHWQGILML